MKVRAVVVGIGARTSIGLDARSTGFAHRAGVAGMTQSAILDVEGEPATMCLLPTLDPHCVGAERAAQLGEPALREAVAWLGPELPKHLRIKQYSCLDAFMGEPRKDGRRPAADLAAMLARRGAALCPKIEDVNVVARGPASMGAAMKGAFEALEKGFDAVIIGGVHSDYDVERITALSAAGRLFTPDNLDALIPGECAAFVVLMKPELARQHRLKVLAEIHTVATAFESARPDNDESAFKAHGLTTAVREAIAERAKNEVRTGWMLTDLNFELMRIHELSSMSTRTQKHWCEPQMCDSPGQRIGYLGAAAMPLHLVLASEAWLRGWAPHPEAISIGGSDAGERAVIALSEPGPSMR